MTEYAIVSFSLLALAFAGCSRIIRALNRRDSEVNQIIPLSENVCKINIIKQDKKTWVVKNSKGKKIYQLKKSGSTWHLQTGMSTQTLSTIKYNWREKYIVMTKSPYLFSDRASCNIERDSPLGTTPSVIRMEPLPWNFSLLGHDKSVFRFGSTLKLQWIGPTHFEIITEAPNNRRDAGITFHERVASLKRYDNASGYSILFDYEKINLEILVSTFLLAVLCRNLGNI